MIDKDGKFSYSPVKNVNNTTIFDAALKAGLTQEQVKKIRELDDRLKGKMRNHPNQ
jgi:hypothetical protein